MTQNNLTLTPAFQNYFATEETKDSSTILVVKDVAAPIDRLITAVIYVSASMTNPQGDIDSDGAPRQNQANQKGFWTAAMYKRKIRDIIQLVFGQPMHVMRRGVLLQSTLDAALKKAPKSEATLRLASMVEKQRATLAKAKTKTEETGSEAKEEKKKLEDWGDVVKASIQYYFDDRTFGHLFLDPINEGSTGPVQFSHFQTLHPIEIIEMAIACCTVPNYKEKETKHSTLGRTSIVNYGLYEGTMVANPYHAARTGFSWQDLNMILNVIPRIWDLTQSSARTGVNHERMTLFIHDSHLGSMSLKKCKDLARPINSALAADMPRQSTEDYKFRDLDELRSGFLPGIQVAII